MYYLRDQSRSAIAEALGISRFKVARLLIDAREQGIVQIHLTRPDGLDPDRARRLCETWRLRHAIVLPEMPEDALQNALAHAAASYLTEHLTPDDVLGLASGRTTGRIARALGSLPACTIVQIIGVTSATTLWDNPTEAIRRMAQLSGGPCYPVFAPFGLGSADAVAILRREPAIAAAWAQFSFLTRAIVTTAPWATGVSMIHDSVTPADQVEAAALSPAAEILGNLIDSNGRPVAADLTERLLTISLDELSRIPDVILVSGGTSRQQAIHAALMTGIVDTLITDSGTARFLLQKSEINHGQPNGCALPDEY
ncbi:transcriptional regulator [Shinella daejeonensis]|uniref:sugar-binding transcriptional regulator n=1 Tax=Shinella daejeonensis TaxID=659017 RepID=UPI0020C7784D|nr:sugar-binding domain-containing protein [Shinella daejeonensis]MCP8896497.1 transcriptional regulator [Shinella daejeonensis]